MYKRQVHNPDYAGTQQLDSLCLGLTALEGRRGWTLVCPADIPLVSDQTARQVLGSHALFARPVFGQKAGHPAALSLSLTPYPAVLRRPGRAAGSDGIR